LKYKTAGTQKQQYYLYLRSVNCHVLTNTAFNVVLNNVHQLQQKIRQMLTDKTSKSHTER